MRIKNFFSVFIVIDILCFVLGITYAEELKQEKPENEAQAFATAVVQERKSAIEESAKDYYQKGLRAKTASNNKEAINNFMKAIELDQNYASAYNSIGEIYEKEHDIKKAEEMYLKAIAIDERYCPAYSNMALLSESQKDSAKALEYWRRCVLYGAFDDKLTQQASLRIKELESAQAKQQPAPTQKPNKDFNFAKKPAAQSEEELQKIPESKLVLALRQENEKLRQEINSFPGEKAKIYQELGAAYVQASLYDLAIDAYIKSLSFNPNNAEVHYNLGLLYKRSRDNVKKSIYHFEKCLQLDPEAKNSKEIRYFIRMLKETTVSEIE